MPECTTPAYWRVAPFSTANAIDDDAIDGSVSERHDVDLVPGADDDRGIQHSGRHTADAARRKVGPWAVNELSGLEHSGSAQRVLGAYPET
jgi:hypothetical protein